MTRLALFALFIFAATAAQAEDINWQDAVARLAAERTRAETCASLLKQFGDEAQVAQGQIAYSDAKGEMDAVIAGLVVALAEDQRPESLTDLEGHLRRGVERREAFCANVTALVPNTSGERSAIVDLVSSTIGPLIEAVTEIYLDWRNSDRITRATIQTQLEATKWPAFDAIQP